MIVSAGIVSRSSIKDVAGDHLRCRGALRLAASDDVCLRR